MIKKAEALLPQRNKLFEDFLDNFNEINNDYQSIKSHFKSLKAGLIHSFMSKHENKTEYYEMLFG